MTDNTRIDDLRRRVQADPASIAFAQLAEECRRAGAYDEAVRVCRSGLQLHPTYLSARVTLGRALLQLGQLDAAVLELETVRRSAPQNLAALRGLADAHARVGAPDKALVLYRQALDLAPNDPELERLVAELAARVHEQDDRLHHARDRSVVAALEQWLNAVHASRTQRVP